MFLGLLNIARIKSQHHSARTGAILANLIALLYLLLVVAVLQEPAAIGVSLPVLALCCISWMNRVNESPKPPEPGAVGNWGSPRLDRMLSASPGCVRPSFLVQWPRL